MTFTGKAGENRREVRRRIMMLRHSPHKTGDYDDNGLLNTRGGLVRRVAADPGLVESVPALTVLFFYPVRG